MSAAQTINNESETMRTEIINVTPELATEWLQFNIGNRDPKPRKIAQYARDMAAGRWAMTGEAIKFAASGRLIDGQNRCYAIIKSGATIPTLVVFGLADDAQIVMDSGVSRGSGDALTFRRAKNANQLAAVAKLAVHWERGEIARSSCVTPPLSNAEIDAAVQMDPTLGDAVAAGDKFRYRKTKGAGIRATPTAIGFSWWLIAGAADRDAASNFMEDLAQMRTDGAGDPRLAALQRLNSARENNEKMSSVTQSFVLITAWNGVRQGRKVHRVQVVGRNGTPLDFPQVAE